MIDQSARRAMADLPRGVVFVRVVMAGSFRSAAIVLGVSPATISHHIKELEESMDVRLLERSTRTMSLTSAGRAFYAEARAALSSWERGVQAAQRFKQAASGCIVVTVPDVFTKSFTVPVVRKLVRSNPDVTVDLRVSTANSDLLAEGIHVALRAGPLPDSAYGSRLLHRGNHRIFGTPTLRADWSPVHPSALASAPWIHFKAHPRPATLTDIDGDEFRLDYAPTVSSDSPAGAVDLATDGLGFIILSGIAAVGCLAAGDLVPVLPEWTGRPIEFHAVTRSPRPSDRKVQLFVRLLQEEFAKAEEALATHLEREGSGKRS